MSAAPLPHDPLAQADPHRQASLAMARCFSSSVLRPGWPAGAGGSDRALGRMNIRPAAPTDASRIAALVRSFEAVLIEDPAAAAPFWESMSQRAHVENIASNRFAYYVAESTNTLVGFIALRDDTHLFTLFVDAAGQGRGVGRMLWHHLIGRLPPKAEKRGVTVNASLNAVAFYRSLGFRSAGEIVRQHGIAFLPMRWERSPDAA